MVIDPRTKFHILFFKWLKIFTVICLMSAIFIPLFLGYSYVHVAVLIPFIHCFVVLLPVGVIHGIWDEWHIDEDSDYQYFKSNYPEIWNKIRPGYGMLINGFAGMVFIFNGYDDGSDEVLNRIKHDWKLDLLMFLWSPLLVLINLIIAFLSAWIGDLALR